MNAVHPRRGLGPALLALALASPGLAVTYSGPISGIWRAADSPHEITGDAMVPMGEVLSVQPGCTILVDADVSLTVDGTLIASGNPQAPIRFASAELLPRAGDWQGIHVRGGGAVWLSSTTVSHARTGLRVETGASAEGLSCQFHSQLDDGVWIAAEALGTFYDCSFDLNGGSGLVAEDSSPFCESCSFRFNDRAVTLRGNSFPALVDCRAESNRSEDGIVIDTSRALTDIGAWREGGLPIVLPAGGVLQVSAGAWLSLEGGLVLKSGAGAGFDVSGRLSASGSSASPVLFTALSDDTAAGDTNRDGSSTSPTKGAWGGLDIRAGGVVNLTAAEIRYADDGVRAFTGSQLGLFASRIQRNEFRGLALGDGVTATVTSTHFHDNDTAIQVLDPATVAIGRPPGNGAEGGDNAFVCNGSFNVENLSAVTLPALRNWWGTSPPDAASFAGPVDTGEFLADPPATLTTLNCFRLDRFGASDLLFSWPELSSCSQYQVESAFTANGTFAALGAPSAQESHLEVDGARFEGVQVRYFVLETGPF